MKKTPIALLLCMVLCLSLFSGCVSLDSSYNDLDTWMFSAHIQPSSLDGIGKKATSYQERLYYLSCEQGTQGIYSMAKDGSDVRFEFAVEDIRSILINDDGFYYCGFRDVKENANGPYRIFRLYQRKTAQSDMIDLVDQFPDASDLADVNFWDFYFDSENNLYVRAVTNNSIPADATLLLYSFVNQTPLLTTDYLEIPTDEDIFKEDYSAESFCLYNVQDQYFILDSQIGSRGVSKLVDNRASIALYDESLDRQVLPLDTRFISWSGDTVVSSRWIVRKENNQLLIAGNNGLFEYDINQMTVKTLMQLPKRENLVAVYDNENEFLLLTRRFRRLGYVSYLIQSALNIKLNKGEALYRFNPVTGESNQLLKTNNANQTFLYVDSAVAATASGKTISVYDIGTDSPVLIRTIELEHEIVDDANKVDSAAGWLFLYGFNSETQRDELLEKVYIG